MKHFFAISPEHVPYMNDVHNMVRKIYSRPEDGSLNDLDVNMTIWGGIYECHSQSSNLSRNRS